MVDLLFSDPRKDDTLPELVDEIGRYRQRGRAALFRWRDRSAAEGAPVIRKELIEAGARVVDPTTIVNQGVVRQYPINGRCMNGEAKGAVCHSLALTVYHDLFSDQPLDVNPAGRMELVWGTHTDPTNAKWMHLKDADGKLHSCDLGIGALRRIYLAFFDPAEVRSRCPYQSVIPIPALLQGGDADVTAWRRAASCSTAPRSRACRTNPSPRSTA